MRELRVDDYGAPPYPEVVLITARRTLERWADFDPRIGIVDRRPDVGSAFDFSLRR